MNIADWWRDLTNPFYRAVRAARDAVATAAAAQVPVLAAALAATAGKQIARLLEALTDELIRRFGHTAAEQELRALIDRVQMTKAAEES